MLSAKSIICAVVLLGASTFAQVEVNIAQAALPDAPSSVTPVERYRSTHHRELLADDPYRPLTRKEKLDHWVRHTYASSTFVSAGLNTAYSSATADFRYCCGASAWGQQYAATLVDTEARNFFGNYFFPTILDQDPRYLPKRKGGFIGRAWYAATRVLVTRSDEGHNTLNSSEVLAVAFSQALRTAYYPDRDRTWGRTSGRIFGTLQGDAGGYLLKEFMPDIKRIFRRHAPRRLQSLAEKLPDGEESQY